MKSGFIRPAILVAILSVIASGCYRIRPSNGAGKTSFSSGRKIDTNSVAVLPRFHIEALATGLSFPTGVTFDEQNNPCVVEAGYAYGEVWTRPRLIRIDQAGHISEIAGGGRNGPWTGVTFHQGKFYVAEGGELEGGRLLRISPDGNITALISNLPSLG